MLMERLYDVPLGFVGIAYFLLMLAVSEAGFRLGERVRRRAPAGEEVRTGVGFVTSGMLALMAFALGLTLSIAQDRFDTRRGLVRDEANAIGTAYLRAQTIGGAEGAEIMTVLRPYTTLRIRYVEGSREVVAAERIDERTGELQQRMWQAASQVARRDPGPISALLLESLNSTFDLALSVRRAYESRVPLPALRLLIWASFLSVGAIGYHFGLAGARHLVISGLLLALWASSLLLIVDLDRPRSGDIRVDPAPLVWTLQGLHPPP